MRAVLVLKDKPEWSKDLILAAMTGDSPAEITREALSHTDCWRAVRTHFYEEIYGYDTEFGARLGEGIPVPGIRVVLANLRGLVETRLAEYCQEFESNFTPLDV